MLIIKVWCLPTLAEERYRLIDENIARAVRGCEGLHDSECQKKGSICILFPPDRMNYGLGEWIPIEVTELDNQPSEVRQKLAGKIGMVLNQEFPKARILCTVRNRDVADGHWEI
jgi:hypothetical protein